MRRDIKKRFTALLRSICVKKALSEKKAGALSLEDKKFMCECIVRQRAAIVAALVPDDPEFVSWLNSMGYGYEYLNKQGMRFNGTSAHFIKFSTTIRPDTWYNITRDLKQRVL